MCFCLGRIPKSGSTLLLSLLYRLGEKLGYLVLRGKYHSYRYFTQNDRIGLGHFLQQAGTRATTAYVQHQVNASWISVNSLLAPLQYYINYTLGRHQPQPTYINLMRDPVDHLVSTYYYKRMVILQHRAPSTFSRAELDVMQEPLEQCAVERRIECVYYGTVFILNYIVTVLDMTVQAILYIRIRRNSWSSGGAGLLSTSTPGLYCTGSLSTSTPGWARRPPCTVRYCCSDTLLYFCGHAPECSQLGSRAALQRAKYNVDHNFAVVGHCSSAKKLCG